MKKKMRDVMYSLTICGITGYSYLSYRIYKNQRKQLKMFEDSSQDTTRPQNQKFGLSWGASTDQYIMDTLDTGDLIFSNFEWTKLLTFQ